MLCPYPMLNADFVDIGGGPPKMAYSNGKSLIFSYFLWSRKVCRKIQDISWFFTLIYKILCGIKTYGTLRSIPHTYFCKHPISRLRGDRATFSMAKNCCHFGKGMGNWNSWLCLSVCCEAADFFTYYLTNINLVSCEPAWNVQFLLSEILIKFAYCYPVQQPCEQSQDFNLLSNKIQFTV